MARALAKSLILRLIISFIASLWLTDGIIPANPSVSAQSSLSEMIQADDPTSDTDEEEDNDPVELPSDEEAVPESFYSEDDNPVELPSDESVTSENFSLRAFLPVVQSDQQPVMAASSSPDLIFADGFESGGLTAWSASATGGGDLSVSTAAALGGTYGLQALINDNTSLYLTDDLPTAEPRYRARFYFDPNSIVMVDANAHYIFYGYSGISQVVLRVEFGFSAGYQVRVALVNDSTTWTNSNWFTITDGPHFIELDWQAATAVGANNGNLTLWIDDVQKASLTGIDNDTRRIDRVRLGAVAGIDTPTRGTYIFDAFESRRTSYIGADPSVPPPPPPADPIFADGFESGGLSAWSASATGGGDLSVSTAAALGGTYGLQAVINDNTLLYLTDDLPTLEPRYRARFYFDPNSILMANNNAHFLLYGYSGTSQIVLRVELRFSAGNYQLRADLLNDANTWTNSSWFTITDGPHFIELDWQAATAVGTNNGSLTLWIDDVQKVTLTGVDNDTRRIDRVRLGPVAGIDTGTRGTYFFDAFESHRQTYIGPVPPPLPQVTDHCGTVVSNETWGPGTVHRLTCGVSVNSGVTLIVAAGAVVKFDSGTSLVHCGGNNSTDVMLM